MAGNTVVLKPSEQTPDSGLMVREVLEKAGLPAGAVEVVLGPGSITGQALIEHPGLDMLFFTGSTRVGKMVNLEAAKRLVPAVMELGGKDVAIVTRHADLDRAAHGVAWASFFNTGQTCIGTELILVDRAVYDEFLKKFTAVAGCLRPGMKAGQLGAMTMAAQKKIVEDQLDDALAKGARCVVGGKPAPGGKGMFLPATVLVDTTPEMKVRTEETFGPLKPVVPYDTIEEAIEIANSTEYGLSGSVYTRDMAEGRSIARRLKTGSVNINDALITYAFPALPFGGVKSSGVGRYHGKMGLRAFTDVKSVTEFNWPLKREPYWYPLPEDADLVAADTLRVFFSRGLWSRAQSLARLAGNVIAIARRELRDRKGCDYREYGEK
jgi:acyl-CoA reductase-like NAD-dependent aldehyde dehydrogenase